MGIGAWTAGGLGEGSELLEEPRPLVVGGLGGQRHPRTKLVGRARLADPATSRRAFIHRVVEQGANGRTRLRDSFRVAAERSTLRGWVESPGSGTPGKARLADPPFHLTSEPSKRDEGRMGGQRVKLCDSSRLAVGLHLLGCGENSPGPSPGPVPHTQPGDGDGAWVMTARTSSAPNDGVSCQSLTDPRSGSKHRRKGYSLATTLDWCRSSRRQFVL